MTRPYLNTGTLIDWFCKWEKETPDNIFLRQPYGDEWKTITYREAGQIIRKMVTAFQNIGLKKGDHIAILSKNCYHWLLADLAITAGGYISVPFYYSLDKDGLQEVLKLGDIDALIVGRLDSWGDKNEAIPAAMPLIRFPHYEGDAVIQGKMLDWDDLVTKHEPATELHHAGPDDLWKIIFTSGTTGTPKGAMHNHSSTVNMMKMSDEHRGLKIVIEGCKYFSYLPLNHIAESVTTICIPVYNGGSISFAESLATFAKNLQETQPGFFLGVPRIFTKFALGVQSKIPAAKLDAMLQSEQAEAVKAQLKASLGLSNAELILTGAAITPAHLKNFYKKIGIHLTEVYGSTETCGLTILATDKNTPIDSVGKPVPAAEMKLDPETDEIILRSPFFFTGYYKDEEKTKNVLTEDGWYYTGDRGTIDENGYLRIIGRVKDAFKTAKGKFITPNKLEEKLGANQYIEQICIAGITCVQPIALINLSEAGMAMDKAKVEAALKDDLEALNSKLASYTKISTIIIQPTWTIDSGLMTPTLKIRRGKIDDAFKDQYPEWHEASDQIIWT
jgi:long-chain acyl-CoA synthetase